MPACAARGGVEVAPTDGVFDSPFFIIFLHVETRSVRMYLEFGLTTGAVMVAAMAMRWFLRIQRPDSIECGQVSGGWLAEHKMSKNNPTWL